MSVMLNEFAIVRAGTESKAVHMDYSYNWPYDYFSLIELAKIDATVEYGDDPRVLLERSTEIRHVTEAIAEGPAPGKAFAVKAGGLKT